MINYIIKGPMHVYNKYVDKYFINNFKTNFFIKNVTYIKWEFVVQFLFSILIIIYK